MMSPFQYMPSDPEARKKHLAYLEKLASEKKARERESYQRKEKKKKYEYECLYNPPIKKINDMGSYGWKMVGIHNDYFYFMRED